MADAHTNELIAAYGALLDGAATELDRVDRLSDLVVGVLSRYEVKARRSRPGVLTSTRTVAVPLPSMNISMEIAGIDEPLTAAHVAMVGTRATARLRPAVLSMQGFDAESVEVSDDVMLLDRHHLEAMLGGLVNPVELLEAAAQQATFEAQPYMSLTRFLTIQQPAPCLQFAPPDRVPPPWELVDRVEGDVRARQVLGGRPGWPEMTGMAVIDDRRLLLTTADGLIEVDVRRGTGTWFLAMRGLRGSPLVRGDGSVLVICHDTVIAYCDEKVVPIAGGLRGAVGLCADREGDAWVLSGTGVEFGEGSVTLSLTRVGDQFGRQQTYAVGFNASVHGVTWLHGRSFYLAAGGNSGVVDLCRSSAVRSVDQVRSEQSYPNHVIALNAWTVLTGSASGSGVGVTIFRTEVLGRSTELLARLRLNKIQGMAVALSRYVYILGDVRGNDLQLPRPVILKATLPHQAQPAEVGMATPLHQLRLAARGERRDYALDPKPIADGGQAVVFSARHRASGARVAFKRLKIKNSENVARMRREVEAGQRFGDNAHVVPVLDFDPAAGWLLMPLASDTAAETLDEFESPLGLLELVNAICEGLRQPHKDGWVHRDLKPANILRIDGIWAVADWGLGRRPRGRTSHPGRTQVGVLYGTEGFAAPELSDDAHGAGPQADIYSLGQLIGWACTKQWPRANRPLIPVETSWQTVVEVMTRDDPTQRPATVDDVLALVTSVVADIGNLQAAPELEPSVHGPLIVAIEPERQPAAQQVLTPVPVLDSSVEPMVVKGLLGRVEFDGHVVTIVKDGFGPQMKGRRAVTIDHIDAVVVKPATRWNHGYIQIIVDGQSPVPEQRGLFLGGRPHMEDSLSTSFRCRTNEEISRLKESIEAAIGRERTVQR
ncbi:protein kinase domain-containing protein [Micromonospora sp. LOL_023]|uniref:protein kinase domain-containing protein n=1 Tax=Micromonospora sp. LOL_023 TaxID=3345418 RepID=UPI003A8393EF